MKQKKNSFMDNIYLNKWTKIDNNDFLISWINWSQKILQSQNWEREK